MNRDEVPNVSPTPDPTIVRGSGALGQPPPLAPVAPIDLWAEGTQKQQFFGKDIHGQKREFSEATRVLYVNGINSGKDRTSREAQAYADAIHGTVEVVHVATDGIIEDLHRAQIDMTDQRASFHDVSVQAVAHEVLSLATSGKDVHIMAYSRGALVTERGLELAESELRERGFSADYVKDKVFSHVTLETVNGASHNVPDGVRAVHYICEGDALVAQSIGMGPAAAEVRLGAAGAEIEFGVVSGLRAEVRDGLANHPNGPIIAVKPYPSLDPLAQHDFINTIANKPDHPGRTPFEKTYAPYAKAIVVEMTHHPEPAPGAEPALAKTTQLHVFQDGQSRTVGHEFHEVGRVFNYGHLVGLQHHETARGLTMVPRRELYAATPHEHHAALNALLRDGKGIELSVGASGLSVHEVPPHHPHLPPLHAHALQNEQTRNVDRSQGMGRGLHPS